MKYLRWGSFMGCLLFIGGMILIPLGVLVARLTGQVGFLDPAVLSVVGWTAFQAVLSTSFSAFFGLLLGLLLQRCQNVRRMSRLTKTFLAIPFGIPTLVAATSWVLWLSKTDFVYRFSAVVFAHVFFNIPWVALRVFQCLEPFPSSHWETARLLGANAFQSFRWVLWPRIQSTLSLVFTQVFSLCVMSFILVMILGGGPPVQTLETILYSKIRYGSLDISGALVCALWELVLCLIPWFWILWKEREPIEKMQNIDARRESAIRWSWIYPFIAFLFIAPYFRVLPGFETFSLLNQPAFLQSAKKALILSLELAFFCSIATLLISVMGVCTVEWMKRDSYSQRLKRIMYQTLSTLLVLPSGISVLVLSIGFWLAYGRWIDPFDGSFFAIFCIQVAIFVPFIFRILLPVSERKPRAILEAARSLGATPLRAIILVQWPYWRAPVLSSLAFVFAASLGEVAAVSLFYSESLIPLPLLITRWMGQYRFEEAQLLSVVLLMVSLGISGLIYYTFSESKELLP